MFQDAEAVLRTLLSDDRATLLFWKNSDGWKVLNYGCPNIDKSSYEQDGLFGMSDYISDKDKELYLSFLDELRSLLKVNSHAVQTNKNRYELIFRVQEMTGNEVCYSFDVSVHKDGDGWADSMLVKISELSPEDLYRYNLSKIITNDKNPAMFNIGAQELFKRNPDKEYALVQFDIAKFKIINQQYGEAFGDELLEYIINTLKNQCTDEQLFVRLTADVFMIMTPYEEKEDLIRLVDRIREKLLGYKGVNYRLVFGINSIKDKTKPLRDFGDGAAFARQSIKNDALKYLAFYEDDMSVNVRNAKWIEDRMEDALAEKQFVMYLQPKFCISTGEVVGAEALVRWINPERGIIPPMEFIPLFEKNGFVIKLDYYIWEEACKKLCEWKENGKRLIPISVNMSRKHMKDEGYLQVLNELVDRYDIERRYLEIEITETFDDDTVIKGVELLKGEGFILLMDDFGSGYSSLNTLKDTFFDILKIDRGFLHDFVGSMRGQRIVEHTIHMSKDIGLDVIAEGVETEEQLRFLEGCGCDVAQGFYYARPMPVDEFDRLY